MNYAVDRLDRRARSAATTSGQFESVGSSLPSTPTSIISSTSQELVLDLRRAHSVFRRAKNDSLLCHGSNSSHPFDDKSSMIKRLEELLAAHELAGKTLRDWGANRQAVFHFGTAWRIAHYLDRNFPQSKALNNNIVTETHAPEPSDGACSSNLDEINDREWKSVGDYAQMSELAGFPEVGVLALIFYRNRGSLDCDETVISSFLSTLVSKNHSSQGADIVEESLAFSCEIEQGCGCGVEECGVSPCFLAFPHSSKTVDDIIIAFDEISKSFERYHHSKSTGQHQHQHQQSTKCTKLSALEILNQLSLLSGKASKTRESATEMYQYMKERMIRFEVPSILQFWDSENGFDQTSQANVAFSGICFERMHSVLLLLLLKLLYSSPISGPFLYLSCYSLPYLSARFPPSSEDGRFLSNNYKSHWAYFEFIRALVLGERIKKKQRTQSETYHTPVWDVIFLLDYVDRIDPWESIQFSTRIRNLFDHLKTYQFTESSELTIHNDGASYFVPSTLPPVSSFNLPHPPIYILGDSHVLSLAWQSIRINSSTSYPKYRTAVPFLCTGIKAWHFRKSTQFFTRCNLVTLLRRLTPGRNDNQHRLEIDSKQHRSTIIVSAGEIDCREGIGGLLLQGYYKNCNDAIERTVLEFLDSLSKVADEYYLQVLILPIAPHAYRSEKNGRALGRSKRRETMHVWNTILRNELCSECSCRHANLFLLDFEEGLRQNDPSSPVGYVLNPLYNADYTHVNSAVVNLVQDSLQRCGCELSYL